MAKAVGVHFEDLEFPSLVSTCASIMSNFVRNHFPIALPPPELPRIPPVPSAGASDFDKAEYLRITAFAERIRSMPDPEPIPEKHRVGPARVSEERARGDGRGAR